MANESTPDALHCIACSTALSFERDVIVMWSNRPCATHSRLSAHYACFRAATATPTCKCVQDKRPQARFPINHGDSLKCAPLWVDTTAIARRQQQKK